MTPDVLCDLVEHMPPDASLWREMDPNTIWTLTDVLLALLSNQTAMANWQRGGGKGAKPKLIRLPWESKPEGQKITGDKMTIDEARTWLGWDF